MRIKLKTKTVLTMSRRSIKNQSNLIQFTGANKNGYLSDKTRNQIRSILENFLFASGYKNAANKALPTMPPKSQRSNPTQGGTGGSATVSRHPRETP